MKAPYPLTHMTTPTPFLFLRPDWRVNIMIDRGPIVRKEDLRSEDYLG
jgi:hypothetical protein